VGGNRKEWVGGCREQGVVNLRGVMCAVRHQHLFLEFTTINVRGPSSSLLLSNSPPSPLSLSPLRPTTILKAKLVEGAMHCEHGDGVHASLMTVKSLCSDNAARATTRAVIGLQQMQAAELRKLSDEALRQAPKRLEHAAKTWLAMSEEQRKVVEEGTGTHELGCTGHSLNLTIEDFHKKTEKAVLEANIVRDLAVNAIQRAMWRCLFNKKQRSLNKLKVVDVCGIGGSYCAFTTGSGWSRVVWPEEDGKQPRAGKHIWKHDGRSDRSLKLRLAGKHINGTDDLPDVPGLCITLSKAFSPAGADAKFYLNEHRHFYRWCELKGKNPRKLPPRKSSVMRVKEYRGRGQVTAALGLRPSTRAQ
jgi:hypothetical protein